MINFNKAKDHSFAHALCKKYQQDHKSLCVVVDDVKTSKTKAKAVEKEEGVIFQEGDLWCFKWGNGQENFTTKEFAETALARLQGVE